MCDNSPIFCSPTLYGTLIFINVPLLRSTKGILVQCLKHKVQDSVKLYLFPVLTVALISKSIY